jgi:hypothetical protein
MYSLGTNVQGMYEGDFVTSCPSEGVLLQERP